mgnify:CR=1 FL=1
MRNFYFFLILAPIEYLRSLTDVSNYVRSLHVYGGSLFAGSTKLITIWNIESFKIIRQINIPGVIYSLCVIKGMPLEFYLFFADISIFEEFVFFKNSFQKFFFFKHRNFFKKKNEIVNNSNEKIGIVSKNQKKYQLKKTNLTKNLFFQKSNLPKKMFFLNIQICSKKIFFQKLNLTKTFFFLKSKFLQKTFFFKSKLFQIKIFFKKSKFVQKNSFFFRNRNFFKNPNLFKKIIFFRNRNFIKKFYCLAEMLISLRKFQFLTTFRFFSNVFSRLCFGWDRREINPYLE